MEGEPKDFTNVPSAPQSQLTIQTEKKPTNKQLFAHILRLCFCGPILADTRGFRQVQRRNSRRTRGQRSAPPGPVSSFWPL